MSSILNIKDLHVSINDQEIVRGITLDIEEGEVHALMGPNGSGKSTLVNALMGHPGFKVTKGSVLFRGKDLLKMEPHERARVGLFLAFQYPKEIQGVTLRSFLFAAYKAQREARDPKSRQLSPITFQAYLQQKMDTLHLDHSFAERSLNEGFSGGEKKKSEVLQMLALEPVFALLDETDSGLDIDALKVVADGINTMRGPKFSCLLVTHYARILDYIKPDRVHVMIDGEIVESGGMELAERLEECGYEKYKTLDVTT